MKKLIGKMDLWLLLIIILLSAFGLVMIYSSSSIAAVLRYNVEASYFFKKQSFITVIGFIIGFLIISRIPTKYYRFLVPFLAFGIISALGLLFLYGRITNGAQSWYRAGIYAIQPAEFAKSIMIICVAVMYNRIYCNKKSNKYASFIPLIFCLTLAILIGIQPDLGGALIVAGIAILTYLSLPLNKELKRKIFQFLGIGIVLFAIVFLFTGKTLLNSMQSSRFNFLNPCSRYQEDTGYQVCNGYIAIHNGGLFGVGLGDSSQKYLYLPESHTDFVFPIICEELGVLVGILILGLYIALLYRIYLISQKASNLRNSLLAYGTFLLILAHVLVNILGVLGLIPLTGVPLPFLSYGGSFNINIICMLFIVERVAIENVEYENRRKIQKI